jgi:hypothetical protein
MYYYAISYFASGENGLRVISAKAVQDVAFLERALGLQRGLHIARTGDESALGWVVEIERSV